MRTGHEASIWNDRRMRRTQTKASHAYQVAEII